MKSRREKRRREIRNEEFQKVVKNREVSFKNRGGTVIGDESAKDIGGLKRFDQLYQKVEE
jgi:hypothetical protein